MGDAVKRWTQGELSLEMAERGGELRVTWRGKSSDRDPSRFLWTHHSLGAEHSFADRPVRRGCH